MSGLITFVVAVACAISCGTIKLQEAAPAAPKTLQDGEYAIVFTFPDAPEDRRTVSHKIRFKVDPKTGKIEGELLRSFDGKSEPSLPVHGLAKGTTLKFAISDVEDGALLTFHFSGKLTDADNASGSFIILRDLKVLDTGTWDVTKSKK